jgi:2-amino-4-hydroxy-6-hydroxymethyldihydropteridine diphosphokinase
MPNATAYLGLGANLGSPLDTLKQVLQDIGQLPGIQTCECSDFFGSAPLDAPGPHYINAVAKVLTTLAPLNLLTELQRLENQYGRIRSVRNAPRTLDLDLLWYDDLTVSTPRLTLPHPRMTQRAFVLRPLAQLTDNLVLNGQTLDTLLIGCADQQCEPIAARVKPTP